jgi:GntR family transcriptional regulator of vanillate catabolism
MMNIKQGDARVTAQDPSQSARIVYQLSQAIVRGEIAAGEKLAEIPLAEQFGVSRTPVRQALALLEQEALLIRDGRSYVVRHFSLQEILGAIEVRSVLEGLAARELAQGRLHRAMAIEFENVLADAEAVIRDIEEQGPTTELTGKYFNTNERFHRALIANCGNRSVGTALDVAGKVPFASVGSIARYSDSSDDDEDRIREKTRLLVYSHLQHQEIFDSIRAGQPLRAEALTREHSHLGIRNLHLHENQPPELAAALSTGFT